MMYRWPHTRCAIGRLLASIRDLAEALREARRTKRALREAPRRGQRPEIDAQDLSIEALGAIRARVAEAHASGAKLSITPTMAIFPDAPPH